MSGTPLELLAPARDAATGIAAITHGADAVYIGGPAYGARAAAGNSISSIETLCAAAHRYHARVYLTLNTLLFDSELEAARKIAYEAYEAGVDALIVQDLALLEMELPPIALHASTQCDIRTSEKAALLASWGFSQLVLARELTLTEIAHVHAAVPATRLEAFVHGALCVSYSGQCYLSAALARRSANRGACAQLCRLPYRLYDEAGRELVHEKHLLSLKDNDQSANLEAMIEAGITSFKIEGRLKDADYVKNITAYYREKLDRILEKHPELTRASLGETHFTFTPDPQRTFFRGSTEYFAHGRSSAMACLDTPKSIGKPLGTVTSVQRARRTITIALEADTMVKNADGLVYFDEQGALQGLAATRAENHGNEALVAFHDSLLKHPDLVAGTPLFRNRDAAFEKVLASERSAVRDLPVAFTITVEDKGVSLLAQSEGYVGESYAPFLPQPAKNPEENHRRLLENLSKTGNTLFRFASVAVEGLKDAFLPASLVNNLRREALLALEAAIEAHYERPKRKACSVAPADLLKHFARDYRGNVANRLAQEFLKKRGIEVEKDAFELRAAEGAELMRCRYCLRYEIGKCPRLLKGRPEAKEAFKLENGGHLKPNPYTLVMPDGVRLTVLFDCKACEMVIQKATT